MSKKIAFLYSISLIVLLSYIIFLLYKYDSISTTIVIHRYGKNVSYGSKLFLFLPIIINMFFVTLVWFVIKYPKRMIKLPNNSDDASYERMQLIIVIISTIATIIYTYILFSDVIYN